MRRSLASSARSGDLPYPSLATACASLSASRDSISSANCHQTSLGTVRRNPPLQHPTKPRSQKTGMRALLPLVSHPAPRHRDQPPKRPAHCLCSRVQVSFGAAFQPAAEVGRFDSQLAAGVQGRKGAPSISRRMVFVETFASRAASAGDNRGCVSSGVTVLGLMPPKCTLLTGGQ
jgi:hypothetical protein